MVQQQSGGHWRARNKETPFLDSLNTGLRRQENVRIPLKNIMGYMVLSSESHAFAKEKLATKHIGERRCGATHMLPTP